jgi:hypothetical protein
MYAYKKQRQIIETAEMTFLENVAGYAFRPKRSNQNHSN